MNSLGKILVVFVTAASLGFAAFSMSLVAGGPNWKGEADSTELASEYAFTLNQGPNPTYSVKGAVDGKSIATNTSLAEAVALARVDQLARLKVVQQDLAKKISDLAPQEAELTTGIQQDEKAMFVRVKNLEKQLETLEAGIKAATDEFNTTAIQIQEVRKTGNERREEAFRLSNQLELLRTDLFAAKKQQVLLADELVRMEENMKRLQRREQQLKQQVGSYE